MEKFVFYNRKHKNYSRVKFNPNENAVLLNFDVREFDKARLIDGQNALTYGVLCMKCSNLRKEPHQVLIIMSEQNPPQFDLAYSVGKIHFIESYRFNQISNLKQGSTFKLPRKPSILHATFENTLSLEIEEQKLEVTLIFESQEERDAVWYGFQNSVVDYLCKRTKMLNQCSLAQVFEVFQATGDGSMSMHELQELLRQIKIQTSLKQLRKQLEQKDKKDQSQNNNDDLCKEKKWKLKEISQAVKRLTDKSEIREIFKYHVPKEYLGCDAQFPAMDAAHFKRFLFTAQKEELEKKEILTIFSQLNKNSQNTIAQPTSTQLISFNQFINYLLSPQNSIFDPACTSPSLDKSRSITDYYVNCSRNFYAAKINSEAAYVREDEKELPDFVNKYLPIHFILRRGVRCASVDVWDGDENEPVILYGYTMNSKIKLSEMLSVFVKYVFKTCSLPFFLEFSFHCSQPVMLNVKKYFETILLPYLYLLQENEENTEKTSYPILQELMEKIVIIGKLPFRFRKKEEEDEEQQQQEVKLAESFDDELQILEEEGQQDCNLKNENILLLSKHQDVQQFHQHEQSFQMSFNLEEKDNNKSNGNQVMDNNNIYFSLGLDGISHNSSPNKLQISKGEDSLVDLLMQNSAENVPNEKMKLFEEQKKHEIFSPQQKKPICMTVEGFQPITIFNSNNSNNLLIISGCEKQEQEPLTCQPIEVKKQRSKKVITYKKSMSKHLKNILQEAGNSVEVFYAFYLERLVKAQKAALFEMYELTHQEYQRIHKKHSQYSQTQSMFENILRISPTIVTPPIIKPIDILNSSPFRPADNVSSIQQSNILPSPNGTSSLEYSAFKSNEITNQSYINTNNVLFNSRQVSQQLEASGIKSQGSNLSFQFDWQKDSLVETNSKYNSADQQCQKTGETNLQNEENGTCLNLELQIFTSEHLVKINPSGKKADDLNFDACSGIWNGVQFLMLSHHQFDVHNLIYSSFFMKSRSDETGFILKPLHLRNQLEQQQSSQESGTHTSIQSISETASTIYYINIISGSQLRSLRGEQVDPQVIVVLRQPPSQQNNQSKHPQFHTTLNALSQVQPQSSNQNTNLTSYNPQQSKQNDPSSQVFHSCIVSNNNSNPIFQFEIKFTSSDPSLSILLFHVVNTRHDSLIGWYAIPLSCIRQGYRNVPLRDENLNPIANSSLLCQIKMTKDA